MREKQDVWKKGKRRVVGIHSFVGNFSFFSMF